MVIKLLKGNLLSKDWWSFEGSNLSTFVIAQTFTKIYPQISKEKMVNRSLHHDTYHIVQKHSDKKTMMNLCPVNLCLSHFNKENNGNFHIIVWRLNTGNQPN